MKSRAVQLVALSFLLVVCAAWFLAPRTAAQQATPRAFSVDQILSLPTPDNLTASPVGATIAWTFNERGVRNIYVASGPDFTPQRVTPYAEDDGQELTHLSFSRDGQTIVYVRGGDHGGRSGDAPPNPTASVVPAKMQVK